jgi:hypothetical protein
MSWMRENQRGEKKSDERLTEDGESAATASGGAVDDGGGKTKILMPRGMPRMKELRESERPLACTYFRVRLRLRRSGLHRHQWFMSGALVEERMGAGTLGEE